ncbi:putative MPP superfamily phosphohydrolase [Metabacillus malikii]|uniref:MPP superfamily phosphohydrolase n=2 Tax=Metabacillus malikii TaxID=1504265 RepID=A0ABT9ZKW1_9BACI|nr:putative MPP superfamily phosphohydrolase [Metabacillus malikii]
MVLIICCVCILLGFFMYLKAKENHLTTHTFTFQNLPHSFSPLKILFISDIHRRVVSEELLSKVPPFIDLVIIGGDLTEAGVPFERVEENLRILTSYGPTYFVFGNNDYEVGKESLEKLLKKYQVTVLNNTSMPLSSNKGETIFLIGVEDMNEERDCLDSALKGVLTNSFNILVSHNPKIIDKFPENHNISLVLSGHEHGGQIRLFGFGLYEKGKVHVYKKLTLLISNGYGTSGIPLRLGAPAEAHYIEITSDTK